MSLLSSSPVHVIIVYYCTRQTFLLTVFVSFSCEHVGTEHIENNNKNEAQCFIIVGALLLHEKASDQTLLLTYYCSNVYLLPTSDY